MLFEEIEASTILHTLASLWTGGTSTNAGMYICGVGHVNSNHYKTLLVWACKGFWVHWRWSTSFWSWLEKALCPASSTADKTVCQVLFFLPVPGFHDSHRSKMSVHACSHRRWSVSAIRITASPTPRKVATCFQSAATSGTMNLLMSSSVGCESMLKWVCVSVGVSVEGETRVGGINHFNSVTRYKAVKCEKLCPSEHLRIHKSLQWVLV